MMKIFSLICCYLLLSACSSSIRPVDKQASYALQQTETTRLGQSVRQYTGRQRDSGFQPLVDGLDALAARVALAEAAEKSIDAQYYIWHNDDVGKLLVAALVRAAERGVRVRILVDDLGLQSDQGLALLDQHPNIELRLFNPVFNRDARLLESVVEFSRINRRMHNKSFTVDNQVSIVGGRNVGNEYFNANRDVNFIDFDVLSIGPVVKEVSTAFDVYWNSPVAIPVEAIIPMPDKAQQRLELSAFEQGVKNLLNSPYAEAIKNSSFIENMRQKKLKFYWGEAHVLFDEPDKAQLSVNNSANHLITRVMPLVKDVEQELLLISPYFIPGEQGVKGFAQLVERGVSVKVLTNSLASTDASIVYAGYAKYRVPLLQAGVELFETRPDRNSLNQSSPDQNSPDQNSQDQNSQDQGGPDQNAPAQNSPAQRSSNRGYAFSSGSDSSLHSKLYMFDRRKVFVGSFNLDPRSTHINTELGVLFESEAFAQALTRVWQTNIDKMAYRLDLEPALDDDLQTQTFQPVWIDPSGQQPVEYTSEPLTSFWQRFSTGFMGMLPIEFLL